MVLRSLIVKSHLKKDKSRRPDDLRLLFFFIKDLHINDQKKKYPAEELLERFRVIIY
ncbi:hypothetical protein BSG1_12691 [Bacillus sp. SG-1]|nr:hypothetical protein BSG1_12691 [Bacillus sp. SG-1]